VVSLSLLVSALALGLLAVPHCGSMCACQFAAPWLEKPLAFQLGRTIAYITGGAVAGGVSASVLGLAANGARIFQAMNWMLMVVLFFSAVLLLWRGQPLGALVQQRIQLSPALQRRIGVAQKVSAASSLQAGLLWLFMPCGVLWAGLMLAYLAGSAFQGALVMAVFALTSGTGLQLFSRLRQTLAARVGDKLMMRSSGAVILLGIGLMVGRQAGWVPAPVWLQGLGFCL
jgi:sulfite exporter TauE/SafE